MISSIGAVRGRQRPGDAEVVDPWRPLVLVHPLDRRSPGVVEQPRLGLVRQPAVTTCLLPDSPLLLDRLPERLRDREVASQVAIDAGLARREIPVDRLVTNSLRDRLGRIDGSE